MTKVPSNIVKILTKPISIAKNGATTSVANTKEQMFPRKASAPASYPSAPATDATSYPSTPATDASASSAPASATPAVINPFAQAPSYENFDDPFKYENFDAVFAELPKQKNNPFKDATKMQTGDMQIAGFWEELTSSTSSTSATSTTYSTSATGTTDNTETSGTKSQLQEQTKNILTSITNENRTPTTEERAILQQRLAEIDKSLAGNMQNASGTNNALFYEKQAIEQALKATTNSTGTNTSTTPTESTESSQEPTTSEETQSSSPTETPSLPETGSGSGGGSEGCGGTGNSTPKTDSTNPTDNTIKPDNNRPDGRKIDIPRDVITGGKTDDKKSEIDELKKHDDNSVKKPAEAAEAANNAANDLTDDIENSEMKAKEYGKEEEDKKVEVAKKDDVIKGLQADSKAISTALDGIAPALEQVTTELEKLTSQLPLADETRQKELETRQKELETRQKELEKRKEELEKAQKTIDTLLQNTEKDKKNALKEGATYGELKAAQDGTTAALRSAKASLENERDAQIADAKAAKEKLETDNKST